MFVRGSALDDDRKFRLLSQTIDIVAVLGRAAIYGICIIWVASYMRDAFVSFAGQHTDANLSFSLITKLQADRWLAYLFGVSGVGYGLFERNLRRRNIKRMTNRSEKLEKLIDPQRSSSSLSPEGSTRKEDR
jgi:hypothetical protein